MTQAKPANSQLTKKVGFGSVGAAFILALAMLLPAKESRVLTTYWDSIGRVWTVCAGVTGKGVIPGRTYTLAECISMETAYIKKMYARMGSCVNGEFHPSVVKAFGHFAYNIGEDKFCSSTAARLLNRGDVHGACKQIKRWRFSGGKDCAIRSNRCFGIIDRREWEYLTCMEGA